jgi:hypothetical protein
MRTEHDINREWMTALLSPLNRSRAAEQIRLRKRLVPVHDSTRFLRLLLTPGGSVNMETMAATPAGIFFKPLGVYQRDGRISLPREFEPTVRQLQEEGLYRDVEWKAFSLEENVLIAAFSLDSSLHARNRRPLRYVSNGITLDMVVKSEGRPEIRTDTVQGLDQAVAFYNGGKLGAAEPFAQTFQRLEKMDMLSAFKPLGRYSAY